MLFLTYWELNPDFDPADLAELTQKILSKKLYPTEGVNQIGWYVTTGDYWGVTITEAQNEEQLVKDTNVWRLAKPGLFKAIKTSPAMEIAKVLPILMKLKKQLE
ncbi:MAG: DUF3303 family protein [Promethearchaeota archaeon]|jgi:hypothetical protein